MVENNIFIGACLGVDNVKNTIMRCLYNVRMVNGCKC